MTGPDKGAYKILASESLVHVHHCAWVALQYAQDTKMSHREETGLVASIYPV